MGIRKAASQVEHRLSIDPNDKRLAALLDHLSPPAKRGRHRPRKGTTAARWIVLGGEVYERQRAGQKRAVAIAEVCEMHKAGTKLVVAAHTAFLRAIGRVIPPGRPKKAK